MIDPDQMHVVQYEDLVLHTPAELTRLGWFLGRAFDASALAASRKPSRTDFRFRAHRLHEDGSPMEFLGEWQQRVSQREIDHGLKILSAFGLDHLYDNDPLPLMDGSRV